MVRKTLQFQINTYFLWNYKFLRDPLCCLRYLINCDKMPQLCSGYFAFQPTSESLFMNWYLKFFSISLKIAHEELIFDDAQQNSLCSKVAFVFFSHLWTHNFFMAILIFHNRSYDSILLGSRTQPFPLLKYDSFGGGKSAVFEYGS